MYTDDVLFKKASKGNIDAFGKLIFEYEKIIYNVAYRLMGNTEDAKDMSQEVLIKIYKNLDKCKEIKYLKSWIYTVTTNTCIDEIRKRKNKYTESLDSENNTEDGEILRQIKSDILTPEEQVLKKEKNNQLQNAINQLPTNYKTIIVLRDINNLSYDEIAKITNLNLGTVKSRLPRARKALKNIILNKEN